VYLANVFSELYKSFKLYLIRMIHRSQEPFHITLHTAIPEEPIAHLASTHILGRNRRLVDLEIRVLSPVFYTRFVHYAYTSEAIDRECIFTDEKNRTLWISRPELLPLLLNQSGPTETRCSCGKRGYLDELRWSMLKKFRCAPAKPAYGASSASHLEDAQSLPFSEFDQYIREAHFTQAWRYRRIVTKLFIASRLGFGYAGVVGLLDLITRLMLCYLGLSQLAYADTDGCSASKFRDSSVDACFRDRDVHAQWWWLVSATVAVCGVHSYAILKGYA
jgi:hypothetical protein